MLHFEVIMYFHLYKYLWLRDKHNTPKSLAIYTGTYDDKCGVKCEELTAAEI